MPKRDHQANDFIMYGVHNNNNRVLIRLFRYFFSDISRCCGRQENLDNLDETTSSASEIEPVEPNQLEVYRITTAVIHKNDDDNLSSDLSSNEKMDHEEIDNISLTDYQQAKYDTQGYDSLESKRANQQQQLSKTEDTRDDNIKCLSLDQTKCYRTLVGNIEDDEDDISSELGSESEFDADAEQHHQIEQQINKKRHAGKLPDSNTYADNSQTVNYRAYVNNVYQYGHTQPSELTACHQIERDNYKGQDSAKINKKQQQTIATRKRRNSEPIGSSYTKLTQRFKQSSSTQHHTVNLGASQDNRNMDNDLLVNNSSHSKGDVDKPAPTNIGIITSINAEQNEKNTSKHSDTTISMPKH
jgi:hypothetical protein